MHLYVAGVEDNNLTCRRRGTGATHSVVPLNISFLMSHMPSERTRGGADDDGDEATRRRFPCENYVTNDHKLNVARAQMLWKMATLASSRAR